MFTDKIPKNWSKSYWDAFKRNIGLVSLLDQEKIRMTSIAIFGIGGLGSPLVEQLARSGCEKLLICDNDKFVSSNLNRQTCFLSDIGKFKVDVLEMQLKNINPNMELRKFYEVNSSNINELLNKISLVVLALDDPISSILIARECKKRKIPLIESWAIPFIYSCWFTDGSMNYETFYGLNTDELTLEEMERSQEFITNLKSNFYQRLTKFPNIKEKFDREPGALEALMSGQISSISFAPIVRLNGSFLAFEVIFSGILNYKPKILAPKLVAFDIFEMKKLNLNFTYS